MNIFKEGIFKYDTTKKVQGVHNIGMYPPLPLGSSIKMSRLCLDNGDQPTLEIFNKLQRELFIDSEYKDGVFVHVLAAPAILVPSNNGDWVNRRRLYLHVVKKEIFHLIEQQEEYEWWQQ